MFEDVDETLRKLFIRDLPIKNGEVDIKFNQPKREWTARLSRPTLNIFMYKLEENQKLRQPQPVWEVERKQDGTVARRRRPVRVNLHYMITSWATDPEDEHRLLSRALATMLRYEYLPEELFPEGLRDQPVPIPILVAAQDELQDTSLMWSALDNEMRPVVSCQVTLSVNPYVFFDTPPVRTRELRFGQTNENLVEQLLQEAGSNVYWSVGGVVHSKSVANLVLTLVERDQQISLDQDGRFVIGRLRAGEYTLEVAMNGGQPRPFKISVPSPDYEIEI